MRHVEWKHVCKQWQQHKRCPEKHALHTDQTLLTSSQYWSQCNNTQYTNTSSYLLLLSDTIRQRCLSFFGQLCPADTSQDHSRALQACICVLPKTGDAGPVDWGKPGWERLRTICTRSILAWRRQGGALWTDWRHQLMESATPTWHAPEREKVVVRSWTSDLTVTITTIITKSNCNSFTLTITITKSITNTKTILKLNQNMENYIKTVTKSKSKLKL